MIDAASAPVDSVPTQWVILGLTLSFAGPVLVAWVTGKFNRQASRDATNVQSRQVDIEEWNKIVDRQNGEIERRNNEIDRMIARQRDQDTKLEAAMRRIEELEELIRMQRIEASEQEDRYRKVAQEHVAWDHLAATEIRKLGGQIPDAPILMVPRLGPATL